MSGSTKAFRQLRTDFFDHEATAGLSSLARAIYLQVSLANIVGILERSLKRLAKKADPDATVDDAREALAELEKRGRVVWWDDLEIAWLIEAADEQIGRSPKLWTSARRLVAAQPIEVQRAFLKRYPTDGVGIRKPTDKPRIPYPEKDSTPSDTPSESDRAYTYPEQVPGTVPVPLPERAGGGGAQSFAHDSTYQWGELCERLGVKLDSPIRGGKAYANLGPILELHGAEYVWRVVEYTAEQAAERRRSGGKDDVGIPVAWLSQMFRSDGGWAARMEAYEAAQGQLSGVLAVELTDEDRARFDADPAVQAALRRAGA